MPTRILREGILTSERVNALPADAEIFYRRLMSVVDDYGRYFAHPSLLRASCFALQIEKYSEADVKRMLSNCRNADLIIVYQDGKYLQIGNFRQQTRAASKFPQPTEKELLSKCESSALHKCSESESNAESESKTVRADGGDCPSSSPAVNSASKNVNDKESSSLADLGLVQPEIPKVKTPLLILKPPTADHTRFIELWGVAFKAFWSEDYVFLGGRDATAVKQLLRTKRTPEDLIALAASAWKSREWACKQALTIHGFASQINQIPAELKNAHKPNHPNRNAGTYNDNISADELAGLQAKVR